MEIPGKVLGSPGAGDDGCVGLAVVAGLPSAVAGDSAECVEAARWRMICSWAAICDINVM